MFLINVFLLVEIKHKGNMNYNTELNFIILKCDQVLKCSIAAIKVNSFNYIKSLKVGEKSKAEKAAQK